MQTRGTGVADLRGGAELLRSPHFSLRLFHAPRIALMTRTSAPLQTVAEVERCIEDFARAIPAQARGGWRVVIDMQQGPTRVHPALDPAFQRLRSETQAGFSRVAVIVATPLGKIRAERLAQVSTLPLAVVGSLEEALEFLDSAE